MPSSVAPALARADATAATINRVRCQSQRPRHGGLIRCMPSSSSKSMYGNTRAIAEAIAPACAHGCRWRCTGGRVSPRRSSAMTCHCWSWVGAPTHAHGMSNPDTRSTAADRGGRGARRRVDLTGGAARMAGRSSAIGAVGRRRRRVRHRLKGPALLWGSAAKSAEGQLRKAGAHVLTPAQSFYIAGPRGPVYDALAEGELDRARRWGERLASGACPPDTRPTWPRRCPRCG